MLRGVHKIRRSLWRPSCICIHHRDKQLRPHKHAHMHTHTQIDLSSWSPQTSNGIQSDTSRPHSSTARKVARMYSAHIMLFTLVGWLVGWLLEGFLRSSIFLSFLFSLLQSPILFHIFLSVSIYYLLSFHRFISSFLPSFHRDNVSLFLFTLCFLIISSLNILYLRSYFHILNFSLFLQASLLFYFCPCFFRSNPTISS
jgi:hypothetical protein